MIATYINSRSLLFSDLPKSSLDSGMIRKMAIYVCGVLVALAAKPELVLNKTINLV